MVERLRELRNEINLSQQRLAEMLGTSQQSINKYENSTVEPDIATLIAMADIFGVTVDYLIGRTPERGQSKPLPSARPPKGYAALTTKERIYADAMINAYIKTKNAAAR